MIYQDDDGMDEELKHYGCAFRSLAYYRDLRGGTWTKDELNALWRTAIAKGIISGDLNMDGDYDEVNELVIQSWQGLVDHLRLPLTAIEGHQPLSFPLPPKAFALCEWFNPATRFRHFVVGSKRPVAFDPIRNGSRTVREGHPVSLRVFVPKEAA